MIQFVFVFFALTALQGRCHPVHNNGSIIEISKCCYWNESLIDIDNGCETYSLLDSNSDHYVDYEDLFRHQFESRGRTLYKHFRLDWTNFSCEDNKNPILLYEKDNFKVNKDGSLLHWNDKNDKKFLYQPEDYCLELHNDSVIAFTCQDPYQLTMSHHLNKLGEKPDTRGKTTEK